MRFRGGARPVPISRRKSRGMISELREPWMVLRYRTAFPDLRFTIEDLVAEGETVVVRWSARGTNTGELDEIEPTGKYVEISGISIARFAGGKMVEGWVNWDMYGMLKQLGLVPEGATATV